MTATRRWRGLRGVTSAGTLVTLDHAVATTGNFGFLLLAGRELPSAGYGLIGIFLAGYLLGMGSLRALTSDLFIPSVRSGSVTGSGARELIGRAVAGSAATTVVLSLLVTGYVAVAGGLDGGTAFWLCIGLISLLLGDTLRSVTLALHRLGWTLAYDAIWTVGTVGSVVALMVGDSTDLTAWWLAYALWAGVAGAVLLTSAEVRRTLTACRPGWRRHEPRVKAGFLVDFLMGVGGAQALILFAAVHIALDDLGTYRIILSELGLLNFLAATGHTVLTVTSSRRLLAEPRAGLRTAWVAAVVLGAVFAGYAIGLAVLPVPALTAVFGPNAEASSVVFLLVALQSLVAVLMVPANFVLKTRRRVRALLAGRVLGVPGLLLGAVLLVDHGTVGLAVGVLAATVLTAAALWWTVVRDTSRPALSHPAAAARP